MDFIMLPLVLISATAFVLSLRFIIQTLKQRLFPNPHLPPGSLGWPLIGETLDFFHEGKPEIFVKERMEKYDSRIFKTNLFGETTVVFCGTAGNKFLCTNENKLVNVWWPKSIRTLVKSGLANIVGDEAKWMRKVLLTFLNQEALKRYTGKMDMLAQQHIKMHWEGKEEVIVHKIINHYTFEISCNLFASIDDPAHISKLEDLFDVFNEGVFAFAINLPGTAFYKAFKAGNAIKEDIKLILRERREALDKKLVSPTQDFLAHLLVTSDTSGRFLSEMEILDNILGLLFASHDTTKSTITLLMKYLAELPQVYEKVFKEQIEIANSKEPGQMLEWEDIQKMTYSWAVVSEVLRFAPPTGVAFREAIVDFTYEGYTIPKRSKLIMCTSSTHKDPVLFPNPEDFDASRFEGTGPTPYSYLPFGGGPRMCLGYQFARLEILVFLHNVVKRFKWDLLIPNDKFKIEPTLAPVQGLPIHLHPHQF